MAKTFDDIGLLIRVADARKFVEGWHNNIRLWRRLYDGEHYTGTPAPGEVRFSDPTYTNAVDLTVGILQSNRMSWKAYGFSPSFVEEKDSSKAEKFIAALIDINSDRNEYVSPFEVILHFARDGGAVISQFWDKNRAKKETVTYVDDSGEEVSQLVYTDIPIIQKIVDPLNVSLLPGGPKRWKAIGYHEMLSVLDVETRYDIKLEQYSHLTIDEKIRQMVEFIDWWEYMPLGGNWVVANARLVENSIIMSLTDVSKWYDELPYTVDLYNPTDRLNSVKWHSVITPLVEPVQMLERSINRRTRQIDIYSSLPFVAKTVSGRQIQLDPGMGNVIDLSEGEDFGFPEWRGNPPDVRDQIDFFRARVQQSGYSDVMYGSGTSSVSGYALSQLGDQNRIRLEQPVAHLKRLWSRVAKKAMDIVRRHAKDTPLLVHGYLRGLNFSEYVTGKDLEGIRVECEIKPEFPNEQVRKTAMATQVKGILADSTIMQNYLGIDQPDDERKKKLVEIVEQNPQVLMYAILAELGDRARAGEDAASAALQTMLQSANGGVNPGGRPDAGPGIANMNGTQSATGLASPQELGNPAPGQGEVDMMGNMAGAAPTMLGGGVM